MADYYLNDNSQKFSKLILIGSYPVDNIPDNITSYIIHGENDKVLNENNFNDSKKYWNDNTFELKIKGANHASIADYGNQAGDGNLEISKDEVIKNIIDFIK